MTKQIAKRLSQDRIQSWLTYWANAKMVNIDAITSFESVYQARKFCECMRVGIFHDDLVSDLEIWRALKAMRATQAEAA